MTATDPAKGHDRWLRIGGWSDSTDTTTGYRRSQLGQPADFHGAISEQHASGTPWGSDAKECQWRVTRQRTEREGPDKDGLHWTGWLAEGTAKNLPLAKSAATKAMKQLRTDHILAGGDVGHGEAPTGEQIRESIARRRALEPGQSMVMESGELDGVQWERRLSCARGTIGAIESFRLLYRGEQQDTLPKGRGPAAMAEEFRTHVDERPARVAAAEQQQQAAIAESISNDQARYRRYKALNVLGYSQVCDAWTAAHGTRPPKSQLIRWGRSGVTEAEHNADWYQAGVAATAATRPAGAGQHGRPGPERHAAQADQPTQHNNPRPRASMVAGLPDTEPEA
jgi:hypothetical protein